VVDSVREEVIQAGATAPEAIEFAAETAAGAVRRQGGSQEEAWRAASVVAGREGGSLQAQASVVASAVERNGGDVMEIAMAVATVAKEGGASVADAAVMAGLAASSATAARGAELWQVVQVAEQAAGLAGGTREQAAAIAGNVERRVVEEWHGTPYLGSNTVAARPPIELPAAAARLPPSDGEDSMVVPFDWLIGDWHVEEEEEDTIGETLPPQASLSSGSTSSTEEEEEETLEPLAVPARPLRVPLLGAVRAELLGLGPHGLPVPGEDAAGPSACGGNPAPGSHKG